MTFRILVVDDEPDIRESLEQILSLSTTDTEVVTAANAKEALAQQERKPADLILSDYRMPGMDGLQLLAEVQKRWPGTPAIMITAYPDPQLAARAVREVGVGLFIAKPFEMEYLIDVVRSIQNGKAQKMAPHA